MLLPYPRLFCALQIWGAAHVSKTVPRSDRKFYWIIQSRIIEGPFAVHLQVGHKSIPMCHRPPAGPRVEVDACETESGRNQCCGGLSIRAESFAVEEKLGIEFPRPPTGEHRPDGRHIDSQEISHRLEVGSERHNRSDIEITVGPAVQPAADAHGQRVVHSRVAEGTTDTHRLESPVRIEDTFNAYDGVQFEQRKRRRGVVKIDPASSQLIHERSGKRVRIDFYPNSQRSSRAHARAHA